MASSRRRNVVLFQERAKTLPPLRVLSVPDLTRLSHKHVSHPKWLFDVETKTWSRFLTHEQDLCFVVVKLQLTDEDHAGLYLEIWNLRETDPQHTSTECGFFERRGQEWFLSGGDATPQYQEKGVLQDDIYLTIFSLGKKQFVHGIENKMTRELVVFFLESIRCFYERLLEIFEKLDRRPKKRK